MARLPSCISDTKKEEKEDFNHPKANPKQHVFEKLPNVQKMLHLISMPNINHKYSP